MALFHPAWRGRADLIDDMLCVFLGSLRFLLLLSGLS
jgi:hypothetical protein